jgi:hypothetical protein
MLPADYHNLDARDRPAGAAHEAAPGLSVAVSLTHVRRAVRRRAYVQVLYRLNGNLVSEMAGRYGGHR